MEEPLSDSAAKKGSVVSVNKRVLHVLVFLVIVLPVVVGVVVWYITENACSDTSGNVSGTQAPSVDGTTTPRPTAVTSAPSIVEEPWKNLRLSGDVIPIHYDITLYPDFYGDHGWFYGNETAELEVKRPTKHILIHTNYMNVTRTELQYSDGTAIGVARTFWYAENQFWVVEARELLRTGKVILRLRFDGSLTRAIVGFYKSTYTNSQTGEER